MQSGLTQSSLLESIPTLGRSLMQMRVGLTPTSRVPTVAADMVTTTSFRRHILVKPVDTPKDPLRRFGHAVSSHKKRT